MGVPFMPLLSKDAPAALIGEEIDRLIAILDARAGDPDLEPDDEDVSDEERMGDNSYTEWHTRGRHKVSAFGGEAINRIGSGTQPHEDDEDDDAGEDEHDREASFSEDDALSNTPLGWLSPGPGCDISDPGGAGANEDDEESDPPELNGDEADGTMSPEEEDCGAVAAGPGCPLADPGGCDLER